MSRCLKNVLNLFCVGNLTKWMGSDWNVKEICLFIEIFSFSYYTIQNIIKLLFVTYFCLFIELTGTQQKYSSCAVWLMCFVHKIFILLQQDTSFQIPVEITKIDLLGMHNKFCFIQCLRILTGKKQSTSNETMPYILYAFPNFVHNM